MDIHFACESVGFWISGGDPLRLARVEEGSVEEGSVEDGTSPFFLRGYACADIDSSSGPPDEQKYLSLAHIWTIERLPLRASVRVVNDAQWAREIDLTTNGRYRTWPSDLLALAASGGRSQKETLAAAFGRRLGEARATVSYSPPNPDGRRFDAHLQITLRLDSSAMDAWKDLWTHRTGLAGKACTVTVQDVRFSSTAEYAASDGLPTWGLFVKGELEAPASYFAMSYGVESSAS